MSNQVQQVVMFIVSYLFLIIAVSQIPQVKGEIMSSLQWARLRGQLDLDSTTNAETLKAICRNAAKIRNGTQQVTFTNKYPQIIAMTVLCSDATMAGTKLLHCGMSQHRMILGPGVNAFDVYNYNCSDKDYTSVMCIPEANIPQATQGLL